MSGRLFPGTSSSTPEGWEKTFYPRSARQSDYAAFYAQHFNTVECDATFYRMNPLDRSMDGL
ncbi:MAG: DUF72 domain-containing protein [Nitrospinota bacterium]